jgi:hypothetical protein
VTSARIRQQNSRSRSGAEPMRQPSAIAVAASCAESEPLNLSRAIRMRTGIGFAS